MAIGTTAAILGSAALGAAGTIAGNRAQSNAQKSAANASQQATDQTIAEQRRQFDIGQQNMQPWLTAGNSALNQLAGLYGLNTPSGGASANTYATTQATPATRQSINAGYFGGAMNNSGLIAAGGYPGQGVTGAPSGPTAATGNLSPFFASPDYQFRQDEQMRALTARNAALGIQDSGAAQRSALQLSGNLASSEFNNYANRLASLAGVGQTAAQNQAAAGANFANSMGNVLGNNAQNLASSYAQRGANNANLFGNLAGIGSGLIGQFGGR